MSEEPAKYKTEKEEPDGYLEELRRKIEEADKLLWSLQAHYRALTGRDYTWFR